MEKMKPGEYKDVIFERVYGEWEKQRNNVPVYDFGEFLLDNFEWGYTGTGPLDFSLNILMHYTNGDEKFSRASNRRFMKKFLAHKKRERNGRITKEEIFRYIRYAKKEIASSASDNPCFELR